MGSTCGTPAPSLPSAPNLSFRETKPDDLSINLPGSSAVAEAMQCEVGRTQEISIANLDPEGVLHQMREEQLTKSRLEEYEQSLNMSRAEMKQEPQDGTCLPANRYGSQLELPVFQEGKHVPVLGLLNPKAGAMVGRDILQICRRTPYYGDRFFDIVDVVRGQCRGGLMDVFRLELLKAKDEAKAMGTRPRVISGGGDGTGSFAIFIIFQALKADSERAKDGLTDTGNGFIWTDAELEESFPALAQMPLGTANDFGNILGWGQKYPGHGHSSCCLSPEKPGIALVRWIAAVMDPHARVVNFDVWGIMPQKGETTCNFKIAELTGRRGWCPNIEVGDERQIQLKEAEKPVPFFVCLYFSAGLGAYTVARFQINRHDTPIRNRLEYARQGAGIVLERTPPQLPLRLDGLQIDCESLPYFPPRRHKGTRGRGYREVGFYNVNWQAHLLHGADRAGIKARLFSGRNPVRFNDGLLDMFRLKFLSILKNPGLVVQTDKKRDLLLTFPGTGGKGIFFQWDGEARFAFSPTAKPFNIYIRKVLNIPVVLGPCVNERRTGKLDNGCEVKFEFSGETVEDKAAARRRCLQLVDGQLDSELLATCDEIKAAYLHAAD